jgi:hypothetical protein
MVLLIVLMVASALPNELHSISDSLYQLLFVVTNKRQHQLLELVSFFGCHHLNLKRQSLWKEECVDPLPIQWLFQQQWLDLCLVE